jgi:hypothetical protein
MTASNHERALAAAEQACKAWDSTIQPGTLKTAIEVYLRERGEPDFRGLLQAILDNDGGEGSKCYDARLYYDARQAARAALSTSKGETDGT